MFVQTVIPYFFGLLRTVCIAAVFAVAGCASTHNLQTDGTNLFGGGFTDEELRPGLYRLTASSNRSLWPNFKAAHETWRMRADALCGANAYSSFETAQSDAAETVPPIGVGGQVRGFIRNRMVPVVGESILPSNHVTTINGYILCDSVRMTVAEAKEWILAQQVAAEQRRVDALTAELKQLGGDTCSETESAVSAEAYFRRGKILLGVERYPAARSCFFLAQKTEENTHYSREACSSLGFMYEMGLGVPKDIREAAAWYRKGGL